MRKTVWIGRHDIEAIDGALDPCAYVARAYKETLKHNGQPPGWARKLDNGQWVFNIEYIWSDARTNSDTIGIREAAALLGATRRAVQTWVDQGTITSIDDAGHARGSRRRILRSKFMRDLPRLRKRLQTPAVLGFKRKRNGLQPAGIPAPPLQNLSPPSPTEQDPTPLPIAAEHLNPDKESALQADDTAPEAEQDRGTVSVQATASTAGKSDGHRLEKQRAANAIEARLREARDARQKAAHLELLATGIAERLLGSVFSGEITRVDALVMFNDLATGKGVPADIRTRVRKQYFGR